MGLSPRVRGAAFSLSEPGSGEGQGGGGVDGWAEKSGSKRLRRLSLGRFMVVDALATGLQPSRLVVGETRPRGNVRFRLARVTCP